MDEKTITERLRSIKIGNYWEAYANHRKYHEAKVLCEEAASEIERLQNKAKRLEDALRGMLEAHLLEDYSNSGHYLDLCGKAWEHARDVIGEECDGVVTPTEKVSGAGTAFDAMRD